MAPGYDVNPGGEGGGTSDHTALTNRDAAEGHPASAVSYDPAPAGDILAATTVQDAIDEASELFPTAAQKDALDGAEAPDGENPFATVSYADLKATLAQVLTALGTMGVPLVLGGLDCLLSLTPSGSAVLAVGDVTITVAQDGTVEVSGGEVTITGDTSVTITGDFVNVNGISMVSGGLLSGIPTADPAVAGVLWSNLGVVMVSAG